MKIIDKHIKGLLIFTGLLTCTMIYAVIAPAAALQSTFGASLSGPVAEIVVRNWGALITLIGLSLIYAAFHPIYRRLIVTLASISKIIFITLVVIFGAEYLGQASAVLIFDGVVVAVFLSYLFTSQPSV